MSIDDSKYSEYRRHLIDHFDQELYGVSDPNWGEPVIIDLTVRNTAEEAFYG